jgi:hypothetical protein
MSVPVAESIANLAEFPWDCELDLIVLTPEDIGRVFALLGRGAVSTSDVETWANALECREDVGYANLAIKDLLHVLANPSLTEPLAPKMMSTWLEKVQAVN